MRGRQRGVARPIPRKRSNLFEIQPYLVCRFQKTIEWNDESAMPKRRETQQSEMVQGTLDMLILKTLWMGSAHGYAIAEAIERGSDDVLQVEHGSLYPALHRLDDRGWIEAYWGTSENNRKAKFYRLTPEGKRQLQVQNSRWEQIVRAIGRILHPATERQP
jgi:transcriptional regulator